VTALAAGYDRRALDDPSARPRTGLPNAAAIAAACRLEVGRREHCLLCGHLSESATPAGLSILVEHHARTQHGGQR
jgi:hypothetical protein